MSVVFWIVGIYLVIRGAVFAQILRNALALRARSGAWTVVDEESVPSHVREILGAIEPWIALGWEPVAWVGGGFAISLPPWHPPIFRVLFRRGTGQWLWLKVADAPEPGNEISAVIISDARAGSRVETYDAPGSAPWMTLPATLRIALANGALPGELARKHEDECVALGDLVTDDDLDAHLARSNANAEALSSAMHVAGDLRATAGSMLELRWPAAIRLATRAMRQMRPAAKQRARRRESSGAAPSELPVELELDAWARQDALRAMPTRRELALGVLAVTGVLFALSLFWEFDPTQLALLTGVVLVHELGHWLAMRLRGYHDARIFFVPFLGGATIGHKDRISLADEMLVLLAGPVPGLAAGLVLLVLGIFAPLPVLATETAMMLIAINGLNLLPLFPLDGGRIVHRLIAQGRPWAEISFRFVGLVGIALGAIWLETPLLLVLPAVMLLGMRAQWAVASIERDLRASHGPDETGGLRRAIIEALRVGLPRAAMPVRLLRARELASRLDAPHAGIVARGAWLLVYSLFVIGPSVPIAWVVATRWMTLGDDGFVRVECADLAAMPEVADGLAHVVLIPEWDGDPPRAVVDPIELFALAGPGVCLPVPWSAGAQGAVTRARDERSLATLRAMTAATYAFWASQAPLGETDRATFDREAALRLERLDHALRAAIDAHADDPDFDRRVALALVERDRAHREGRIDADAELAAALGASPACHEERPIVLFDSTLSLVSRDGARDLGELSRYLCAGGMRAALIRVEPVPWDEP